MVKFLWYLSFLPHVLLLVIPWFFGPEGILPIYTISDTLFPSPDTINVTLPAEGKKNFSQLKKNLKEENNEENSH
jgi:hypothetical protein